MDRRIRSNMSGVSLLCLALARQVFYTGYCAVDFTSNLIVYLPWVSPLVCRQQYLHTIVSSKSWKFQWYGKTWLQCWHFRLSSGFLKKLISNSWLEFPRKGYGIANIQVSHIFRVTITEGGFGSNWIFLQHHNPVINTTRSNIWKWPLQSQVEQKFIVCDPGRSLSVWRAKNLAQTVL